MSETTPTTPKSVATPKPPRDNSLQDTKQANEIAYTERLIDTIQSNNALQSALAALGFDAGEMAKGSALQDNAFKRYTERQTLLAVAAQDRDERDKLGKTMEDEFSSYRQTVQALYKGTERSTLGASGLVSNDQEVFVTNSRTAYTAAQKEPYASKLATRGISAERITAALAALDQLSSANTKSIASHKTATAATKVRNTAVKAMNDWAAELKKVAKANLKTKPELLALLQE